MSTRFGQGRDLKFAAIDSMWNGDFLLASVGSNLQIKVVSYALSTTSGSPFPIKFLSGPTGGPGTRSVTGEMQLGNNRPPSVMIGSPIAHLFETDVGKSLYARTNSSVYVGGHITYFYENLAATGK